MFSKTIWACIRFSSRSMPTYWSFTSTPSNTFEVPEAIEIFELTILTVVIGFFRIIRPIWKSFKPTFEHILSNLRHHKTLLEEQATAIIGRTQQIHITQYNSDAQQIRDHLKRYERDRQKFVDTERDRQELQHTTVQAWFASPDVEREHLDICHDRERYPKSGDWILDQEKVKAWLSPDQPVNSMLCINGNPGTGKYN